MPPVTSASGTRPAATVLRLTPLDFAMNNAVDNESVRLREMAERALRLASTTTDQAAHDALMLYAQELLAKVEKLEAEREQGDPC